MNAHNHDSLYVYRQSKTHKIYENNFKCQSQFILSGTFYKLQVASLSTSSAIFLSHFAVSNASINSILAVSASGDNSFGSGIAKGAKSTLAFAIKGIVIGSQVILTGFATVRKAIDSIFSGVVIAARIVASRGYDNEGKENNGLFQKM